MLAPHTRPVLKMGLLITLWFSSPVIHSGFAHDADRPNVLFIMVDDLRPELGCYGAKDALTPNLDRLAEEGVLFERAYCQQAVCNPSRTSLMTGMRPDRVGVTGNHVHFRSKHPNLVTLPQHFKANGYHSQSIGKIYHGVFPDGASKTVWDTMGDAESWSVPTTRFGPRYYFTEEGIEHAKAAFMQMYRPETPGPNDWTEKLVFGLMTESPDVDDSVLYDGKVADAAIDTLTQRAADPSTPFFLAVGFIKPHSPFVAPKKYFDLYDPSDISLATNTELPQGAPAIAGHRSSEVRRYTDQPKQGPFDAENQRRLKHSYLACVSFIDAQIGRVLDALEELNLSDNTIVVVVGDHGWHLGEHGLWGKTTNFELDTRVPLIVRSSKHQDSNQSSSALVELIDLYPTLCDMADLPIDSELQGKSFSALLQEPSQEFKVAAYSQYPRGGNADLGGRVMGYSMRTQRIRYTEWIDREQSMVVHRELYDYQTDPDESKSLASMAERQEMIGQLSTQLHEDLEIVLRPTQAQIATGFEALEPGPLRTQNDDSGNWSAEPNHATVHSDHQRSGRLSMRILGGESRQVVWTLQKDAIETQDGPGFDQLNLWFERWTRRQPFDFRIEVFADGEWTTLHHDTQKAVVGSFANQLSLSIENARPEKFRFTATTPDGSGVMLDDVRLTRAVPMTVTNVTARQLQSPVLVRNEINPTVELVIETEGSLEPIKLEEIGISLSESIGAEQIESIQVLALPANSELPWRNIDSLSGTATRFGDQENRAASLTLSDQLSLQNGANHFVLSLKLNEDANPTHHLAPSIDAIRLNGALRQVETEKVPGGLRIGYAVRKSGDDDAVSFRIPGLVTTNEGTLIGVYDVRYRGWGDLPGDIDVGMSRSTDGGRTWEPMKLIMDMGNDPDWNFDGVGDPAVLVDRTTNTIWVAATWSHGNRSWFGSGPGLKPDETGQLMLVKSEDDGVTWSEPINITAQVKDPEWCFLLQGPGRGITMRDGTIVFAAQYQDTPENKRLPRSSIIYSRDHGETWAMGTGAFDDTTEAQVAEIEPGVLMLNCRYNRESARVVMITEDMGETWTEHSTSRLALREPRACMASLIHAGNDAQNSRLDCLLFSNPDSLSARDRMTIKASVDNGTHWPASYRLLIDESLSAGYSCLTMIDEETVGILFEGSRAPMTFLRIPLSDIIGDKQEREEPVQDQAAANSALTLPQVFGNHMVLQANATIPIWGTARPHSHVIVELGGQSVVVRSDRDGNWLTTFEPRPISRDPIHLVVTSKNETIELKDILLGEVWVCAGQSNMEWPVSQTESASSTIAKNTQPAIRLLNLPGAARGGSGDYTTEHVKRLTPNAFCRGEWSIATPESIAPFSAVGFYFGQALHREMDVPIGLISPAIGGTPIEAWISPETLSAETDLMNGNWLQHGNLEVWCQQRASANLRRAIQAGESIPSDSFGPNHSFKPGFMWQAGIEPLGSFPIQGVLWYQGESNAESEWRVEQYRKLFQLLVSDLREHWNQADLPILYVQLPSMNRPHWPEFRNQQREAMFDIPHLGMAITMDLGAENDVHPRRKEPVGARLAAWALTNVYEKSSDVPHSGPIYSDYRLEENQLRLMFELEGSGLCSSDGKALRHFEVAGSDGKFVPAFASIEGNEVVVISPDVEVPKQARYAWQPYIDYSDAGSAPNLTNDSGLPASPFVTR